MAKPITGSYIILIKNGVDIIKFKLVAETLNLALVLLIIPRIIY